MCYTIIVGLPHSAQKEWLPKLPPEMQMWAAYEELSPAMDNASTFVIAKGMCSCALFSPSSYGSIIKKYQRKGWSDSRIERTLGEISQKRNLFGLDSTLRSWLADVADNVGLVYLFAHWVSNPLHLSKNISVSSNEFRDVKTDVPEEQVIHIIATR